MKKLLVILWAVFSGFVFGQQITQVEYFFDEDPGFGQGQAISITAAPEIEVDELLSVQGLSPGNHALHIRIKDSNNNWSSVISQGFYIDANLGEPIEMNYMEYFFDEDPGFGQGQSISISEVLDIEINQYLSIQGLSTGFHALHIRTKDKNNQWSSVLSKGFYLEANRGTASEITNVEYFYDQDPGFGDGIPYTDFEAGLQLSELFFANVSDLEQGNHAIFIRMKDALGQWSQTLTQSFELLNCDLSISGTIKDPSNNPITAGFVVLYQYFGEGSAMGVDTIQLTNGNYQFSAVCPISQYYIKAFPNDETLFMPTYFGDSPYWEDAIMISTEQSSLTGKDIHLTQFANMAEGTSQLKGHVYYAEFKGQPVKNVDVVLEYDAPNDKAGFQPAALDRSDEAGEWNIAGLPIGSFRIKVEIPGLGMDTTYYIEIVEGNSVFDHLDFYVDLNTGIFIDHTGIQEMNLIGNLQLFPNPTRIGHFTIQSNNTQLNIEKMTIYQYSGQLIKDFNKNGQAVDVDVNDLPRGFYLVKIQTNQGTVIQKLIIQ